MLRFLGKRLFHSIFVIIGISILIFVIARVIPGNPARLALGERASAEAVEALSEHMHLNEPLYIQYYYWASDLLKGSLGTSFSTQRPVVTDIKEYLPATLELVIFAGIFQLIFAFLLGLLSAKHKDRLIDSIIRVMAYVGISVPSFVWAVLFILFFGHIWTVLPVFHRVSGGMIPPTRITGMYVFDYLLTGNITGALNAFSHLFLPSMALAIGHIFQEARILRSSIIDNMSKEFISVTTGFGIPNSKIMYKYLLKPSAISVVTVAGLDFASTMGNAFLVETVFNWPGLSRYGMVAMLNNDLNAISAVVIIIGLTYMVLNIIVDIAIAALDPRVRLGD